MQEKQIDEKESLELISRMIRNTQNHLDGNEGVPFLVWGYTVVLTAIAVWLAVSFTQNYYWHFLWFAIPVFGSVHMMIFNKRKPQSVKTYIDKAIGYVWMVLGIACVLFAVITFFVQINILSIILMLVGVGCAITGLIIKYIPVTIGGFVSLALSVLLLLLQQSFDVWMFIFIAAFIATYVIPGHCLRWKARKSVKLEGEGHV